MRSRFVFAVVLVTICTANLQKRHWELFKSSYGKNYSIGEDKERIKVFIDTKNYIKEHNLKYKRNQTSFFLGLNKLADWFPKELSQKLQPLYKEKFLNKARCRGKLYKAPSHDDDLPKSFDWRPSGAVTEIQDEGLCGSCYAFSAINSLESIYFIKHGRRQGKKKAEALSVQNVIDCSGSFGNKGCKGGLRGGTFQFIKYNGGINSHKSYPYEWRTSKCRYDSKNVAATCKGCRHLPRGNEKAIMSAVVKEGPVSFTFKAGKPFIYYKGGILKNIRCGRHANHAMVVIGYGTDKKTGQHYWLVKNSWGKQWGIKGYIKMARYENICDMAADPIIPIV